MTLTIVATEEEPAGFLDQLLTPLRCAIPPVGDWTVSLSPAAAVEAPSGGRRIFEGPLPEGLHSVMVMEGEERILVVPDHVAMVFRPKMRTTDVRFVPGKEGSLSGTVAFWLLQQAFAAHARHLLHGALVVEPETDRAIAIFAPSGTGKSTTALALSRVGYHFGGDDVLVLDAGKDGCGLWAIPRKVKVHRRTAAFLPWLAPILKETWTQDEQAFARDALAPLVTLAEPRRRPVALVVALMPPNDKEHRSTAIAKPEALSMIACDNIRVAPGGVDANHTAALGALAKLIATTPVISLSVGPDPASLSRALLVR